MRGKSLLTPHSSFPVLFRAFALFFVLSFLLSAGPVSAQTSPAQAGEKKRAVSALGLVEREEALRKEEARLAQLRKELDRKIEQYSELLGRMEEALRMMETAKDERFGHLIKAYEAMPAEESAVRLSELDETTAVRILSGMKSKKAGAAMAAMDPGKAASLTEGILKMAKNFPTK